jgi:TonB family protein
VRISLSIIIALLSLIGLGNGSGPQSESRTVDSAIAEVVSHFAGPLEEVKPRRVLIFDLRGPRGEIHPAGKWLARQLAAAMRTKFPKFEIVDHPQLFTISGGTGSPSDQQALALRETSVARSAGADVFIAGLLAKISENQMGVALRVQGVSTAKKEISVVREVVPISKEISELSQQAIPSLELKDGVPRGGAGGIPLPTCLYCPSPRLPRPGGVGVVVLEVVVTTEGTADKIKVIKSPDQRFTDVSIETVQKWRFKPAVDFDGNPIAVFVPVQLTFQHR